MEAMVGRAHAGQRTRWASRFITVALLLAACGPASSTALTAQGLARGQDGWYGLPVAAGRTLPPVTLTDVYGNAFRLDQDLLGRPTLLFFGYTSCPDICPIHLSAIASAMQQTRTSHDQLQVVFVSVDPERDTPARIETFLGHFDRRMIGLHGELDEVRRALDHLDLPGPVIEGADPRGTGVLIGHPAQVIGFDADGVVQRVWPFGTRRADWVADLPRITERWS
jgi:protein SCO1